MEVALFDLLVLPPVVVSRQVDVLSAQWRQMVVHPVCQEEPYNPGRDVSINPNENSIRGTDQIAVKIQHKDRLLTDPGAIEDVLAVENDIRSG